MENLRFKSVFDIIGPVMIGPSSSHTAGACRIGKIIRTIFGDLPENLELHLYESFAKTYRGHGTDIALIGGVLGFDPDDRQLANSKEIAKKEGMDVEVISQPEDRAEHPNTARLVLKRGNRTMTATGISIGGGSVIVSESNGFNISITLGMPTFIIVQRDVPGVVARVTTCLSNYDINIAKMNVTRESKGEKAIMIIEVDTTHVEEVDEEIKKIPELENVNFFV
jgi:L-serine dehydratase